ncbi:MAG: hypothetical protein AAF628_23405 [Planctomycetota bacterium]
MTDNLPNTLESFDRPPSPDYCPCGDRYYAPGTRLCISNQCMQCVNGNWQATGHNCEPGAGDCTECGGGPDE